MTFCGVTMVTANNRRSSALPQVPKFPRTFQHVLARQGSKFKQVQENSGCMTENCRTELRMSSMAVPQVYIDLLPSHFPSSSDHNHNRIQALSPASNNSQSSKLYITNGTLLTILPDVPQRSIPL
jgi:hypothetical protein